MLDLEGHLSDVALSALADGVELEPGTGAHVERCEACAARLADVALASIEVGEALRDRAALRAEAALVARRAEPRLPRGALWVAGALVVLGSLPDLAGGASWLAAARVAVALAKRALRVLVDFAGDPSAALASGLALMVVGGTVAVVATRLAGSSVERGAKRHVA
jgi:hypothetical protein